MSERAKIAVVGAGIYGATAAIKLAEKGHRVTLFDPLGLLQAASAINQYRVHAGYHYPRSVETILEVKEARQQFLREYEPAIVQTSEHLYAIPRTGSLTSVDDFERRMREYRLPLTKVRPDWMNFGFIERCWRVDEALYDPSRLRNILQRRIDDLKIALHRISYNKHVRGGYDFVIWATYGLDGPRVIVNSVRKQVAEKVLVRLPTYLQHVALVVIDGPFTAFDPYGDTEYSLFGSAKHTNHWSSDDLCEPVPAVLSKNLHLPDFYTFGGSHFPKMVEDCVKTVPAAKDAEYLGSRLVLRVVEHNPGNDQRLLYVRKLDKKNIQIFSGKVVGAVKAAQLVVKLVDDE